MLIVGLGNYGLKYRNTYHNMGFMVADKLAKDLKLSFSHRMCKAKVAYNKDKSIIIAKPQTYMNLSGEAVVLLLKKFNQTIDDLIVIYDDIDIKSGVLRIREKGSSGTHNGMRNIIGLLEDDNFKRFRVGIGRDPNLDLVEFVLSKIKTEDRDRIELVTDKAYLAIKELYNGKTLDNVKSKFNG